CNESGVRSACEGRCSDFSATARNSTQRKLSCLFSVRYGGESGIRTHVTLSSKHAFQACAFSHSAISPARQLLRERKMRTHREKLSLLGRSFDSMGCRREPQPAPVNSVLDTGH